MDGFARSRTGVRRTSDSADRPCQDHADDVIETGLPRSRPGIAGKGQFWNGNRRPQSCCTPICTVNLLWVRNLLMEKGGDYTISRLVLSLLT